MQAPRQASPPDSARRVGDQIAIDGAYQFRVLQSGPAPQRFWHEAKLREAQRWLSPAPGDLLLDVGCGSGVLASRLASNPAVRVIGVDGNRAAVDFASHQYNLPNLEFRHGLVDELGFEPNSIDKIAFLEVIEHITPDQGLAVLRCFHRILKPGGLAVVSTPNMRSLWPLIEWTMDTLRLAPHMADDQHVAFYHRRSLAALGRQAGLTVRACRTVDFLAPWLAALSWKLAEAVHRLETARSQPFGSLLLMTFEKPLSAPSSGRGEAL